MRTKPPAVAQATLAFAGALLMTFASPAGASALEYRDPLDLAVAAPDDFSGIDRSDRLDLDAGYHLNYDNNLFRLPASVTDISTLPGIGLNPSRNDYTNSVSGGLDAEWLTGARQALDVDLRVDDNFFVHNSDLNNVSTNDRIAWNYGLGSQLSGQVGADYSRVLAGFMNTEVYS